MNAKTVFTFAGGMVVGMILWALIFSGPSPAPSGYAPAPAPQQQPQVDVVKLQRDIAQLEQIAKSDPGNYQAWKKLGDNYFDIGEQRKSIAAYRKALDIDGSDPNVLTDMGVMYRQLGEFSKALESFQAAAEKAPSHSVSRLNIGVVYVNDLKDYAKGIAAWEDFLRVEPTGARADSIRAQLVQIKQMLAAQGGDAGLPPDHPDLGESGAAPAPGNPATYFPKPDQQ
jgi:cytochrome c-type biogenesis protein CcmH/NrfG